MSKTYIIKSPAKINIGLYVRNRRKDGYHNIETIFYPIALWDEIKIKIRQIEADGNIITVKTNANAGIDGKDNICCKTAEMFLEEFKIQDKYKIDIAIRKRIPIGSGLGGGSSNAATVLKVLSKHFSLENQNALNKIALRLGSDVPFFLLGKPAFAESRGEKLTPLPKFKIKYNILLVNPNIHVSTKWAYGETDIKKQRVNTKGQKELNMIQKFELMDKNVFRNDFEKVVFDKYHSIGKIKQKMFETAAVFSSMSGSGSSVYGLYEKNKPMPIKYFKSMGYKVFLIRK